MFTPVFSTANNFSYHWCGRFIAQSPDWIHMTRSLNDYELMLVTEGELHIAANELIFSAFPGDYILMPPTENQHGVKNAFASFYWLHFGYIDSSADTAIPKVPLSEDEFRNSSAAHSEANPRTALSVPAAIAPRPPLTAPLGSELRSSFEMPSDTTVHGSLVIPLHGHLRSPERIIILMKQLQDSDRRYRNNALNSYLTGAILAEISLQMKAPSQDLQALSKEQTCQDIREYISWHLGEPLKCSQIADYFGYNEKYLTTLFRHRFGISLKQYIIREKMERAKALLTESDIPVAQISYQLGFADAHNFSHAFSSAVGMTPGKYRKAYDRHNIFDQ